MNTEEWKHDTQARSQDALHRFHKKHPEKRIIYGSEILTRVIFMGSSAIALNRSTCGLSKKKNDYKHFSVAIKHELAERCDLNFTISKWRTETVQFKLLRDLGRLKTLQIIMILKHIVLRTAC